MGINYHVPPKKNLKMVHIMTKQIHHFSKCQLKNGKILIFIVNTIGINMEVSIESNKTVKELIWTFINQYSLQEITISF